MEPEENKLKQIRTFEGDVANAIKNQKESIVSIQRAETKRKNESIKKDVPEENSSLRTLLLSVLTLVFAALGGVSLYFAYTTYIEKSALPAVEIPPNQFIPATSVVRVDASTLSRQAMIGVLAIERDRDRADTAITQIQLQRGESESSETLTPADFLLRINSHASNPLIRAMTPLFMLGVMGTNPPHTFIIIELNSFENAFPGMLDWESRMIEDLLPFFAEDETVVRTPTNSIWRDVVVQNRDARTITTSEDETVLIYGFFENRFLIISDNEDTFETIMSRLEAQKLLR